MHLQPRKKSKCLITTIIMLCLIIFFSGAAWASFQDTKGHWAEDTINKWVQNGMITGYPGGNFGPSSNVTRAEFITMVNRALGLSWVSYVNYSDVNTNEWYYNEIAKAVAAGYINEYPESGLLEPNKPITRQEVAVMLAKAVNLDVTGQISSISFLNNFKDIDSIDIWRRAYINGIVAQGYIQGYPDGTFGPTRTINRAESVVILDRAVTARGGFGSSGPSVGSSIKSIKPLNPIGVKVDDRVDLPSRVEVVMNDGRTESRYVNWDKTKVNTSEPGDALIYGTVSGTTEKARQRIFIVADTQVATPGSGSGGSGGSGDSGGSGSSGGSGDSGGSGGSTSPPLAGSDDFNAKINYNTFISIIMVNADESITSMTFNNKQMHFDGDEDNNIFSFAETGLKRDQNVTFRAYDITGKLVQTRFGQIRDFE